MKKTSEPGLEWFSLAHYKMAPSWGAREWFFALSCRYAMHHFIGDVLRAEFHETAARAHFDAIAADPIMASGCTWGMPGRTNPVLLTRLETGVAPVNETAIEMARDYWHAHLGESFALLAVDLAASDKSIKDSFNHWLKNRRGKGGGTGEFTAADMRQWSDAKVLPYLDLELFQRLTKTPFTRSKVARLLFEDDASINAPDPLERLRKVTKKHAMDLMKEQTIQRFAAQMGVPQGTDRPAANAPLPPGWPDEDSDDGIPF